MAGVPHGGNMWKNIIIGVLTTVVAYVIVHFLFDKKPGKEEFKKRKAATTEAWESLMIYERTFKNTGTQMACSGDLNTIGAQIVSEYEKIIENIINIKDEKKGQADNMVMSLIDRRIATLKKKKDATSIYYANLDALDTLNARKEEKDSLSLILQNDFIRATRSLDTADNGFMNDVNTELKKKYKVEFRYPPPFALAPEKLYGNWTLDREGDLSLKEDKSFSLKGAGESFSGKWRIDSLTLRLNFSDGDVYRFVITGGTEKVILMQRLPDSSLHFLCR